MLGRMLKRFVPRGLYGRAALIVFVPVLTILLVFSVAFIQRHYDGVTRQMTGNFVLVVDHIVAQVAGSATPDETAQDLSRAFGLLVVRTDTVPADTLARLPWYDLSGQLAERELRANLPELLSLRLTGGEAAIWMMAGQIPVRIEFSLSRISARNPHQLIVLMAVIGVFMSLVSFVYLKNQMRPIQRLARAAEAFGRGERHPLRIGGATEVRAAGYAFVEMRERIERHIEQRTLLLSGVSHDLRTPLTRLRLSLSLLSDEPEATAMARDLSEMEALIDRFLEFARAQSTEDPVLTDLAALVQDRCSGRDGVILEAVGPGPFAMVRPQVLSRAVDNLVGNALRYGVRARVQLGISGDMAEIVIEDAGPGIPADQIDRALRPFVRLDASRGGASGSGVGLGLAIVADAVRSHGGKLHLGQGETPGYGGLRARILVPLAGPAPGAPDQDPDNWAFVTS